MDIAPDTTLLDVPAGTAAGESPMRRWIKRLLKWAVIIALVPYVLILVYAVDFIRPVSTLMLWDLATLKGYDRRWVEFEDISPVLVQSVMVSEDGQFCSHFGVDLRQLKGVVDDALAGTDLAVGEGAEQLDDTGPVVLIVKGRRGRGHTGESNAA